MKQNTNNLFGIAVVSVLAIGLVGGVLAHGGFGPGFGHGWGGHHGMMGGTQHPARVHGWATSGDPVAVANQFLGDQRTALNITADQQPAWDAYAEAIQARAARMETHHQARFNGTSLDAGQRLDFHQQGFDQLQAVIAASQALYDQLTPDQQARAGGLIGLHGGFATAAR